MKPSYYLAPEASPTNFEVDIVVYGATSGGVAAALQAARSGKTVALLAFGDHVGGMSSSGLGRTDYGRRDAYGGIARELYRTIGRNFGEPEGWYFAPSEAQRVFASWTMEPGIVLRKRQHLAGVEKSGSRITAIRTDDGSWYRAKAFIDASYEGDLMASAEVTFTVGREANEQYGEHFNGIHFGHPNHNFRLFVDPYRVPGKPSSGLLPQISDEAPGVQGESDRRVQAYNFRMCLSRDPEKRLPITCPGTYDPANYELLARYLNAGIWDAMHLSAWVRSTKSDTNNFGAFSSDFIGANHEWPEAGYARREELFQAHVDYTAGLYWFLQNDPRVPEDIRSEMAVLGLPTDEFESTGGWPPELYVREARRMVSSLIMTEHHCIGQDVVEDPIALAAYQMDSHHCRRIVLHGRPTNEGNVEIWLPRPFGISYRAVLPRRAEAENLLVPWCLSASHIAFGSIRMEPVFMTLGQSCAVAACLAIDSRQTPHDISYTALADSLRECQIPLEWAPLHRPVHGGTCNKTT